MTDIKRMLQAAIDQKKQAKQDGEIKALVAQISQEVAGSISPDNISNEVAQKLVAALTPAIEKLAARNQLDSDAIARAVTTAIQNVHIQVPEITIPPVIVPRPEVNVTVPPIRVPDIIMPDEMNIAGWVNLMTNGKIVGYNNPLPVELRDSSGNPIRLFENLTSVIGGGGGGGKADFLTIKGFSQSAYSELTNADGRLKVSVETGGSGLTDNELRATAVPVSQVSGANWSVSVAGFTASIFAIPGNAEGIAYNTDNPLPITIVAGSSSGTEYLDGADKAVPTGTLAMGDTGEESGNIFSLATHAGVVSSSVLRVVHVADVAMSTNITNTSIAVTATDLDIRDLANASDSVRVYQLSGASWSTEATQSGTWNIGTVTTVTGVTNSVAAALIDSSGVQYSTQNPLPIDDAGGSLTVDGTVTVSGVTASIAANIVDSGGVAYTTTNPVPIVIVSGSQNSTLAVGPVAGDVADDGSAPVQGGGIARTANPTAVAANDVVKSTHDDLGRQVMRPIQVRDLIKTAYVSVTGGTETTLRAAVAGAYLDCILLTASNNSDAAVSVDIRAVTAGNIVHTLRIPANGTAGWAPHIPWPQDETGNNWTVDGPDETGRTLTFSALFSQEV